MSGAIFPSGHHAEGCEEEAAGLHVEEYRGLAVYVCAVYGRGAMFLNTLRSELGDDAFDSGVRSYFCENRYGIATRADFQRAMEQAAGHSLETLFDQ